jgi:REP element-mobilizing transposase RayT
MPQSLSRVLVHIVFSTKKHFPFLSDREVRREMHRYLAGACKGVNSPAIVVGGTADHVHILLILSRRHSLAEIMKEIKWQSSRWIKSKGSMLQKFEWQRGYGVFSVGESSVDGVRAYIDRQEQHHRKKSFREEYCDLLRESGIEYDDRYMWD